MQTRCSNKIDLWELAATGSCWEAVIPLSEMTRLVSLLSAATGQVKVLIEGGIDEQGIRFIIGRFETSVEMACQRCLENMTVPLTVDCRLGLIHAESQAGTLPQQYDPLLVPTTEGAVSAVVEDELLLVLPFAPRHQALDQCQANGFVVEPQALSSEHPFAALAHLLKDPQE